MADAQPGSAPDYVGHDAKLPMGIKIAYGAPNFAGAGMGIPIGIHMSIFYADVVLLPLGYIALGIAVARAFDAITDPLMGWLTDRTNTRWGRRRPWMLVGAPLCAVAFVALFTPPEGLTTAGAAWWFGATFIGYFLFHTVYTIPHYGLGPELTLDYRERSSLFGWMEGFTVTGTMVAAALPFLVLGLTGGDQRETYRMIAIVFGSLLTILYTYQCIRIKERPDFYQRKANPIAPGLRRVFRNRPFRVLLSVYVVGSIAGAIPGLMAPYFTKYVLRPENPDVWLGILLLSYFGAGLVTLPLWIWAARRFGKKRTYLFSFWNAVIAHAAIFFCGEGDVWAALALFTLSGSVFGARAFLGPSMQADVIDYDELYTGKRREAQYGSMWAFTTKFTVIPSASIPLAILASVGYLPNVDQTPGVVLTISSIFAFGPALFGMLAFFIAIFFPITEAVHQKIREGIEAHARGEIAIDPLTGGRVPPPSDSGVDEDTGWFLDHFGRAELRQFVATGASRLLVGVLAKIAVSAATLAGFGVFVLRNVDDLSTRPPLLVVLCVVASGVALGAIGYHLLRLRACLRLRAAPIPADVVLAHLDAVEATRPTAIVGDLAPASGGH